MTSDSFHKVTSWAPNVEVNSMCSSEIFDFIFFIHQHFFVFFETIVLQFSNSQNFETTGFARFRFVRADLEVILHVFTKKFFNWAPLRILFKTSIWTLELLMHANFLMLVHLPISGSIWKSRTLSSFFIFRAINAPKFQSRHVTQNEITNFLKRLARVCLTHIWATFNFLRSNTIYAQQLLADLALSGVNDHVFALQTGKM
jgi:hypothetical protein